MRDPENEVGDRPGEGWSKKKIPLYELQILLGSNHLLFIDLDSVSGHKHAKKKELGQYQPS